MDSAPGPVFTDTPAGAGEPRGRDSIFLLARMKLVGRRTGFPVRVRNISAGGLMAELPEPVLPDSAVEIELRGLGRITGRVAWQTEGRAGIAFDFPIDPKRVRKPVGKDAKDAARGPARTVRFAG